MSSLGLLEQVSKTDLRREIARELARRSILDFTLHTKPDYQINWHHRIVARYLDMFARGELTRLMVFMPPRHGKSELVSRRLPAYLLGRNPDAQIISTSYSADLANAMNRDVQRIIDDPKYDELFPSTRLSGGRDKYKRTDDLFEVVGKRGSLRSAGVGGGITGMGANYIIIDDPVKNREEAESPTYRNNVWNWYTSTLYTRKEKGAAILLTVTRWHQDDLAGRLLQTQGEQHADKWTVVNFPAIADGTLHPDDPRQPHEALWPDKYDTTALATIKATVGSYDWSALYQQEPVSSEGGLFKREKLRIIETMPSNVVKRVRFWDLAMSSKTTADYNVGGLLALCSDGSVVVEDVDRAQRDWGEVEPHISEKALEDGTGVEQAIEMAFYQSSAVKALLSRPELHNHIINGVRVHTDKYTRALPFAARVEADKVFLLRRSWNQAFIDELCAFPLGRNDDQVDVCSGAYERLGKPVETTNVYATNPFYQ